MRIITLNTWGGRAGKEKLLSFFQTYREETDIFCLQEIWAAPYEHLEGSMAGGSVLKHEDIMVHSRWSISELLSDYSAFFHPHLLNTYGLMTLVKKNLSIKEQGDIFVHRERGYLPQGNVGEHARNIQYVTMEVDGKLFTVINFHGLWNGQGKTDTEDRLNQSRNIVSFLERLDHPFVLCGNFNLLPDTESVHLLEQAGLRNLIKEYGIISTRTSYYQKPGKYADYVFPSQGIQVKDFKVLPEEVSDHAALQLEIQL